MISLPWGLYHYEVIPQGIKAFTNIFQQHMSALYYDMDIIDTFLDDSMVLSYGGSIMQSLTWGLSSPERESSHSQSKYRESCGQNKKFHWSDEHESAFKKGRPNGTGTYPQYDQPFIVFTYSSKK
jgi:hypothetical protein